MTKGIDWDRQIGRRLRLRDLHIFHAVMQQGSMAGAATYLGVSQPAISEVIGNLEGTLGVRLFDRGPRGVEPTVYARTLLQRTSAAFDELRQGVREIEFMADPASGELNIGSVESVASSLLPAVVEGFTALYPRVVLNVDQITVPTLELPRLRDRSLDVVLARIPGLPANDQDLHLEVLFKDRAVLVAGAHSKWARRRRIDLAELLGEPWVMLPSDQWNKLILEPLCRARGLPLPKPRVLTFSVHLRASLLANGPFITIFPKSLMRHYPNASALKVLPVELPMQAWPITAITLKHRTLNPVGRRFIEHMREFARTIAEAE